MYETMPIIDGAAGIDSVMGMESMMAGVAGFFAAYAVVALIVGIMMIVAMWIIFKKAGKPGWASIVPIYNSVVMYQVAGLNPWLLLLALVPVVGMFIIAILGIVGTFRLAKAFGKGVGFGFGLLFLAPIFYLILAFGSSEYVGIAKK